MMRASETTSTPARDSSRSVGVASAPPASAEQQALSFVQEGGNQFFLSLVGRGAAQPRLRVAPTVQRKCAHCKEEEEKEGRIRRAQRGGGEDGSIDTAVAPDSVPAETLTEVPGETQAETRTEAQSETPSEVPTEPVAQTPSEAPGEAVSEPEPSSTEPAAPALLVEDDAAEVGPTQMKKTEFLDALRPAVCRAVDAGLSGTGLNSDGCPHVEYWFEHVAGKSVSFIERSIQRFAPEAQGATAAADYIPAVASRVLQSSRVWATTRRIEGVPDEVLAAAFASSEGEAGAEGIPRIQFKARPGVASAPDDVSAVRDELGSGRPFDGGVRARMESAYGVGFGHVRVHTDSVGAQLSDRLNARAFTIGEHVAFGPGEYRPGTLVGDALIAHELAHVVQQTGASEPAGAVGRLGSSTLEADADRSAFGVMTRLLTGAAGEVSSIADHAIPRLRSGLTLQRCKKTEEPGKKPAVKIVSQTVATTPADRARTKIGIGEEVNCSTDPATTATWSVTGGGAIDTASGTSTKFTAKKSPSTSVVKAEVGKTNLSITFEVVAPDGLTSTVTANPGNGTPGPPNNRIGFKTLFDCIVQPDTVAFNKIKFRENIPNDTWTWPDGTADSNGPKIVPWTVGEDNKTTDTVTSALRPIGRLSDGTTNRDFSYTIRVPEDYKDDAGTWVTWLPNETHMKAFEGATQKGKGTLNATNSVTGSAQGPWQ